MCRKKWSFLLQQQQQQQNKQTNKTNKKQKQKQKQKQNTQNHHEWHMYKNGLQNVHPNDEFVCPQRTSFQGSRIR